MPVPAIAGQAGCLNAEHGADLARANLRNHPFKSGALHLTGTRAPQIFIDYLDLLEAKQASLISKTELPTLALLVVNHLPRRGLPNINNRAPFQVFLRYFRIHCCSSSVLAGLAAPLSSRSASAAASSCCLSRGNVIGLLSQNSRFIWFIAFGSGVFFGVIRALPAHLFH